MKGLRHDAVFGFVKPYIDVHTLGITTAMNLLRDCGYRTVMAGDDVPKPLSTCARSTTSGCSATGSRSSA